MFVIYVLEKQEISLFFSAKLHVVMTYCSFGKVEQAFGIRMRFGRALKLRRPYLKALDNLGKTQIICGLTHHTAKGTAVLLTELS